jgi:archaellum component FlaG (FlaF/FlaG flagellin family)
MSMGERAGHAIQVANIRFGETKTTLYVQNVGEGSLTLDSVSMDDNRLLITPANCTVASQQTTTMEKGQTAEITVNQGYRRKVHIKVVCRDGTFIEGDWGP